MVPPGPARRSKAHISAAPPARPGPEPGPACVAAVESAHRERGRLRLRVLAEPVLALPAAVLLDQGEHGGDPAGVGIDVVDRADGATQRGVGTDDPDGAGRLR